MTDALTKTYITAFETAMNNPEVKDFSNFMSPLMVDHAPWPGHTPDVTGFAAGLSEMRSSFPDLQVKVNRAVREGDLLAVHLNISGTQLGPFMGKPPSGKTFNVEAMDLVRLREGKIVEHWGVMDAAGMAQQLS
jgi:predicted ester cyclase